MRPVRALLITDDATPMKTLLHARGFVDADITVLPYASSTARKAAQALENAATWSTQNANALTVIAFCGHGGEIRNQHSGTLEHQAWIFGKDGSAYTDDQLVAVLKKFAANGEVAIVNECCFALGIAKKGPYRTLPHGVPGGVLHGLHGPIPDHWVLHANLDLVRYHSRLLKGGSAGVRWVMLGSVDAAGGTPLASNWTADVSQLAVANKTASYEWLIENTLTVQDRVVSSPGKYKGSAAFQTS